MKAFEFKEIRKGFYSIEMDYVRSFMFVSETEILLVDLGIGGDALKAQVKAFKDLPIRVVFTHADRDHIGDASDFDDRMMHPAEWDYYAYGSETILPMQPIWEGDVISIGAYCLEIIHIPGHTPGSIALLDREHRFLIGGDSVQKGPIFMFGRGRNLEALGASMDKLEDYLPDFDVVYACHHDLENKPSKIDAIRKGVDTMLITPPQGIPQERFENKVSLYQVGEIAFFI